MRARLPLACSTVKQTGRFVLTPQCKLASSNVADFPSKQLCLQGLDQLLIAGFGAFWNSYGVMRRSTRLRFLLTLFGVAGAALQPGCGKGKSCARTSDCASGLVCNRTTAVCVDPSQLIDGVGSATSGGGSSGGGTGSSSTGGALVAVAPAENELVLSEIAGQRGAAKEFNNADLEFVELFNTTDKLLDLTNLFVVLQFNSPAKGTAGAVEQSLPLSGNLAPHSRLVLARNQTAITAYYPDATVLAVPQMRINMVVKSGSSVTKYQKFSVAIRTATSLVLDTTDEFDSTNNRYLAEPYGASVATRRSAWRDDRKATSFTKELVTVSTPTPGVERRYNSESWGTPGSPNTPNEASPLAGKLMFAQWSTGEGAATPDSDFALVEIRNRSTESIDLMGLRLDQVMVSYPLGQSTLVAPTREDTASLMIGRTPVKASLGKVVGISAAADTAHLSLAAGESLVLARRPLSVVNELVSKRISSQALFTQTTHADVLGAFRITAIRAGAHSGFVIPAMIAVGSKRSGVFNHLVLRDRQNRIIDQAGGLGVSPDSPHHTGEAVNGFHHMQGGKAWHADFAKSRAVRTNWFSVGRGRINTADDLTAMGCGDFTVATDRSCFKIGMVMQDVEAPQ